MNFLALILLCYNQYRNRLLNENLSTSQKILKNAKKGVDFKFLLTFAVNMGQAISFSSLTMKSIFWLVSNWMLECWAASVIINKTISRIIEIVMGWRCLVATSVCIHWASLWSNLWSTHGIVFKEGITASFLPWYISGRWLGIDTGMTGIGSIDTSIEFVCDSIETTIAPWINVPIACDLTIFELNIWCSAFGTFLNNIWWCRGATAFNSILHKTTWHPVDFEISDTVFANVTLLVVIVAALPTSSVTNTNGVVLLINSDLKWGDITFTNRLKNGNSAPEH